MIARKTGMWGRTVYGKSRGSDVYVQALENDADAAPEGSVDNSVAGVQERARLRAAADSPMVASNRFQDIDWIEAESYLGTIKYAGHSCLVFAPNAPVGLKVSSDAFAPFALTAPQLAFIDAETRYPVEIRANGVFRVYKFSSSPDSLALPDDLAKAP